MLFLAPPGGVFSLACNLFRADAWAPIVFRPLGATRVWWLQRCLHGWHERFLSGEVHLVALVVEVVLSCWLL
jgi:hypothetical protein